MSSVQSLLKAYDCHIGFSVTICFNYVKFDLIVFLSYHFSTVSVFIVAIFYFSFYSISIFVYFSLNWSLCEVLITGHCPTHS